MEDKQSMNLSAEEARHIIQEKKKLIEQLQKEIQSETKKMQKNRNSIRTHKAMKLYGDLIAILGYDEIEKNKSVYRQDLINLGNWGRSQSDDYWLKKIIEQDGNIMVTDVRVPFEYETFKKAGAISIRVECPRDIRAKRGNLVGEDDITEVGLDNIKDWDYVIHNDSTYDELKNKAMVLIEELKKC